MPLYPQYAHSLPQSYVQSMTSPPIKQEFYGDDEMNPFSMSYASINDMTAYQDPPVVSRHPQQPYQRSQSFPTRRG